MSKLSMMLTASATSLLVLCGAAALAQAKPLEGQGPADAAPLQQSDPQMQLARNGDEALAVEPQNPERFVRVARFSWSKAAVEQVMRARLTIESALPYAVKEVELACAQFARSGVEIDRNRSTITEVVPAHGRVQVEALDLGPVNPKVESSGCRVVSVTPA